MASRALATAFVNLVPGTKDIDTYLKGKLGDDMEDAGKKGGEKLGGGMVAAAKSFVAPLVAAFSAFAVVDFFKGAIDSASTLAESQNAIKVTFGEASGAIAALGEDSARRLGLSTAAFNGIATQFSAFAQTIAGEGGNVAGVIDELSTRGADFASVMNLEVSDALALFQSGLAGETEPLRRYGIDLSAAAVEAYAMANGIGESGRELTEAEKVQARYGSLLAQTNKVAGDFANTSDGLANSQRIANAELENSRARLGNALLPVMASITTFLAATFIPVLDAVGAGFQWMADNANISIPILAGLAGILVAALAPAIWAMVTATWAWTAALLANPITWIVLGIGLLIAAVVALIMNWEAVVAWITDVFGPVFEWLGGIFTWLWETILKPVVDAIAMIFTWLYENIILPIIQGIVIYVAIWGAIFDWLWKHVLEPTFKLIGDIFNWIYEYIIKPIIAGIVRNVEIWGMIFEWLYKNIIQPTFKAIGDIFNWIWNNVIKPVIDFIVGAVQNVGKIFGDVFGAIGKVVGDAFNGLIGIIKGPINAIIDLINGMIDGINNIKIDIPEWARQFFGGAARIGFKVPKIPRLAKGGYVDSPTTALIGEAGPEVVTPLRDFERMMGMSNRSGQTVNYYAAPNQSIDAEQALFTALKRAKVLSAW